MAPDEGASKEQKIIHWDWLKVVTGKERDDSKKWKNTTFDRRS